MNTTRVGNARSAWLVVLAVAGTLGVLVYLGVSRPPAETPPQTAIALNSPLSTSSGDESRPFVDVVAVSSLTNPADYAAVLALDAVNNVSVPLDQIEPGRLTATYSYRATGPAAGNLQVVQQRSDGIGPTTIEVIGQWSLTLPPSGQPGRTLVDFTASPATELALLPPLTRAGYRVVARTAETINTRTMLEVEARVGRVDVFQQTKRYLLRYTTDGRGIELAFGPLEIGHLQAVANLGPAWSGTVEFALLSVDTSGDQGPPPTDLGSWTVRVAPGTEGVDIGRLELQPSGDFSALSAANLTLTVIETTDRGVVSLTFDLVSMAGDQGRLRSAGPAIR